MTTPIPRESAFADDSPLPPLLPNGAGDTGGRIVLQINGKDTDLTGVIPLKLKDWREIKKLTGKDVTMTNFSEFGIEIMVKFLTFVFRKGNPAIVEDDTWEMTLPDLHRWSEAVMKAREDAPGIDRPT